MAGAHLQRVRVQEARAVGGRRRGDRVVERALHLVGEPALTGQQQHAPRPLEGGDGGARLGVRPVRRQLVGVPERLVLVPRAGPARHVGAGRLRRVPEPQQRGQQVGVPRLGDDVRDARGQVHLPDGVPRHLGDLAHGRVVLVVRGRERASAEHAGPAQVDLPPREVEVGALTGEPVELHQRGLDLGVAAVPVLAALPEATHGEVGEAAGDVEQVGAARGPRPRDGRLDQVAEHVQLVAPAQVGEDLVPAVQGVQVPVVTLHGGQQVDQLEP